MPDFQANIQVEATEGASLKAIDTKINQWKSGIKSTINFTASGLDDIEKRLKALKDTKINIVGGSGSGGGGRGGGGGGSSRSQLSSALASDIKRYNNLQKASVKAGQKEKAIIDRELKSLDTRINGRLGVAGSSTRVAAQQQLQQGRFDFTRASAQLQDRQAQIAQRKADQAQRQAEQAAAQEAARVQRQADQEAARVQRQAERQAAAERRQDFRKVISAQKEYDKVAARHSITDPNSNAYQVEKDYLEQLYDTRKNAMAQMGKFSAAEQKQYRDTVNSGKAIKQQIQFQKEYKAALEADALNAPVDEHTKRMLGYDFLAWKNQNGRAHKAYGDRISEVDDLIDNIRSEGDRKKAVEKFEELQGDVSSHQKGGMTFGQKLKESVGDLTKYISPMMIMNYAKEVGKAMYKNVEQIDAGMTELRKVTNNSEAEYKQFGQNAKRTAVAVGTTQRELINSSADWARLNN